jgi:hypothetical protein
MSLFNLPKATLQAMVRDRKIPNTFIDTVVRGMPKGGLTAMGELSQSALIAILSAWDRGSGGGGGPALLATAPPPPPRATLADILPELWDYQISPRLQPWEQDALRETSHDMRNMVARVPGTPCAATVGFGNCYRDGYFLPDMPPPRDAAEQAAGLACIRGCLLRLRQVFTLPWVDGYQRPFVLQDITTTKIFRVTLDIVALQYFAGALTRGTVVIPYPPAVGQPPTIPATVDFGYAVGKERAPAGFNIIAHAAEDSQVGSDMGLEYTIISPRHFAGQRALAYIPTENGRATFLLKPSAF